MSSDDAAAKLPGTKHKVIGLVSGGKDSCFNMMHVIANGHEVVALATLTPRPGIGELSVSETSNGQTRLTRTCISLLERQSLPS